MLRKAKIKDVPNIIQLINHYAANGEMLARSRIQLYNSLRDFMVVEENNTIIGCGALNIVWEDIAEVRSLAITPDQVGKGYGREIVEYFLQEARNLEIPTVFTLTYKPGFFEKLGFQIVDKKELPHKVWKDCINCPHFPDCDEIAMIRKLN